MISSNLYWQVKPVCNHKKQYIKHDRWLELWQQSTKNPRITQVDIRRVKHTDRKLSRPLKVRPKI